jgi:hypothetical protein
MEQRARSGVMLQNDLQIGAKQQEIQLKLDDLIPLFDLKQAKKKCNDNIFFLALTSEVHSAGAKMQKFLRRLTTIFENSILKKLDILKMQDDQNYIQISELENILKLERDSKLKVKLKDLKIFECLNAEKATPLLLDLAKKTSSLDSVSNIRDSDGKDFVSN